MTAQFHAGQEVAVLQYREEQIGIWRNAKIIRTPPDGGAIFNPGYETTLGVFDAKHIRTICKYGDPLCPCPDGDPCHYEGKNPMRPPVSP